MKGELCVCMKRELRKLFNILNSYQDDLLKLQQKVLELENKHGRKK